VVLRYGNIDSGLKANKRLEMAVNILKLHFKKQDSGEMKTNA
jgi:hypothetical protein